MKQIGFIPTGTLIIGEIASFLNEGCLLPHCLCASLPYGLCASLPKELSVQEGDATMMIAVLLPGPKNKMYKNAEK